MKRYDAILSSSQIGKDIANFQKLNDFENFKKHLIFYVRRTSSTEAHYRKRNRENLASDSPLSHLFHISDQKEPLQGRVCHRGVCQAGFSIRQV